MILEPRWKVEDWEEYIENCGDTEEILDYAHYVDSVGKIRDLSVQEERFNLAYENYNRRRSKRIGTH